MSHQGERLRLADPWGPLLAVAGLVVFALRGIEGPLTRDVALYAYAGQQLADGVPPYVSVFNRAGPLAHLVPGVGAVAGKLAGADELLAMRVTMAGVSALAVWAAYLLGRDLFSSRAAGGAAAASLLVFQGFVTYATTGPREKTTMVLLALVALWLMRRRRWVATGVAVALATLTWQGVFFPLAAAGLVAVLAEPGWRAKGGAVARVCLGGIATSLVAVLLFAGLGILPEFIEAFIGVHLVGSIDQAGLVGIVGGRPQVLVNGFGWSLWVVVAGLVLALALGVVGLVRWRRDRAASVGHLGIAAATVVCLLWSLGSFQGWPDAFLLLPSAAVGVAAGAHLLTCRLRGPWYAAVAVPLVAAALVAAGLSAAAHRSVDLRAQRSLAVDLVALAGDGATMQSIGSPQPLVLTGLRNPIRYQVFESGLARYIDVSAPGGLAGIARGIREDRPTFLVSESPPPGISWLRQTVEEDYRWLGNDGSGSIWFVTDTMPREQVASMRELMSQRGAGWLRSMPPSGP